TIFKVVSLVYENDKLVSTKTRFFVSSMKANELSADKWLELIVARWGVESVHQILDVSFCEDKHPWITKNANGALVVMLLRRLVYTLLTLYKSVTLRSEQNREMTWRELMSQIRDTLLWAREKILDGLRPRKFAMPPALC
ncbi:MAG: ISAs1 family transposase, partial [Deltaproteobacteria bacterium]|nr:ISAs1 family transposase [Deltaproteobacteria bacterium]